MALFLWAWLPATSLLWAGFLEFLQGLALPEARLLMVRAETQELKHAACDAVAGVSAEAAA